MSDKTKPICAVCKQAFRVGDEYIRSHVGTTGIEDAHARVTECIAAAVRRCREIAGQEVERILNSRSLDRYDRGRHDGLSSLMSEIEREFKDLLK